MPLWEVPDWKCAVSSRVRWFWTQLLIRSLGFGKGTPKICDPEGLCHRGACLKKASSPKVTMPHPNKGASLGGLTIGSPQLTARSQPKTSGRGRRRAADGGGARLTGRGGAAQPAGAAAGRRRRGGTA
eukprot:scaffold86658_cov49-Phaeocystis_antarctica.AAC.2